MYLRYFIIISPWKRAGPFIWTNMNPLRPRMLCAKFGWNWPSGFEDENVKSLQRDGQTDGQTDDGRQVIRKAHLSFQLRWAKNCIPFTQVCFPRKDNRKMVKKWCLIKWNPHPSLKKRRWWHTFLLNCTVNFNQITKYIAVIFLLSGEYFYFQPRHWEMAKYSSKYCLGKLFDPWTHKPHDSSTESYYGVQCDQWSSCGMSFHRGKPVLRSAKRAPANVRLLNNSSDVIFYCSVGERSWALALLNAAQVDFPKFKMAARCTRCIFLASKLEF